MKRFIVCSLAAIALIALVAPTVRAEVDVSLNIVFNNPLDHSQGGSWSLVAKTDTPNSDGIVGLTSRFVEGTMPPSGTVASGIGHDINGGALLIGSFDHDADANTPDQTEFVYGQDPNGFIPGLVLGVGLPGGPSDVGSDFLGNPTWDNASEIAFGTISDLTVVPDFAYAAANEVFETIGGGIVLADIGELTVRYEIPEPAACTLALAALCLAMGRRRQ